VKRLVFCFDGTWNRPDQAAGGTACPSNVTRLAEAVLPVDAVGSGQLIYYHRGVGTDPGLDRWLGGLTGWGMSRIIQDGYRFLIRHYQPGDELFVFGFSRGAYLGRSLVGLIRNSGILLPGNEDEIDDAYRLYRSRKPEAHPAERESVLFRRSFSVQPDVRIRFLGVWDTVGALGVPGGLARFVLRRLYEFHDVKLSGYVDNAFQALALDERRRYFQPTLWEKQDHSTSQVLEQVWFPGVHTNVGGGYPDAGLSDNAFLWLADKAARCGLALDIGSLKPPLAANPCGRIYRSRTGLYRLVPWYVRPVCKAPNGFEGLHLSIGTRMKALPKYRPPNV
jgi:uncharacterized protein (DUF2235 family)